MDGSDLCVAVNLRLQAELPADAAKTLRRALKSGALDEPPNRDLDGDEGKQEQDEDQQAGFPDARQTLRRRRHNGRAVAAVAEASGLIPPAAVLVLQYDPRFAAEALSPVEMPPLVVPGVHESSCRQ